MLAPKCTLQQGVALAGQLRAVGFAFQDKAALPVCQRHSRRAREGAENVRHPLCSLLPQHTTVGGCPWQSMLGDNA